MPSGNLRVRAQYRERVDLELSAVTPHVTRDVPLSLNARVDQASNAPARRHRRVALRGPSVSACTAEWTRSPSGGCTSPRSYRQGRRPAIKPRRCAPGYCTRLIRNARPPTAEEAARPHLGGRLVEAPDHSLHQTGQSSTSTTRAARFQLRPIALHTRVMARDVPGATDRADA